MESSVRTAILVIDMVNDFVTGVIACDRAQRIIPNQARLLDAARRIGAPVVYVGDAHLPTDFELKIWGEHAMRGTAGADIIPELPTQPGDYILEKRTYDAFYETGLDMLLRKLDISTVCITGLHTNMCDRHTAASALFRGYEIVVPDDCVDAFTEEEHLDGLDYLRRVYGAEITRADALIDTWSRTQSAAL